MYAPLEQIDQVEYASKITDKLFTFFEDYFEIKYSLPKSGEMSNKQTIWNNTNEILILSIQE